MAEAALVPAFILQYYTRAHTHKHIYFVGNDPLDSNETVSVCWPPFLNYICVCVCVFFFFFFHFFFQVSVICCYCFGCCFVVLSCCCFFSSHEKYIRLFQHIAVHARTVKTESTQTSHIKLYNFCLGLYSWLPHFAQNILKPVQIDEHI